MTMSRFLIPLVALAAMGGQAFAQTATQATAESASQPSPVGEPPPGRPRVG